MAAEKVSFGNVIIFALALAEVTSWTIDLPEFRKHVFEKNEREIEKEEEYDEYKYKTDERDGAIPYSNIEGNSKHNTKHYDDVYGNTAYARGYGYESYMEKKVHAIVYNGSMYLEGLRKALENYTRDLESCDRINNNMKTSQNTTSWRPSIELFNSTNLSNNSTNLSNNSTNLSNNSTNLSNNSTSNVCRQVTSKSEHVRRLAELAMWAARELQDIAYARKYHKGDDTSLGMEENELVLKLAWFLDRLAHYTGYEPEPKEFVQDSKEVSSTTLAPTAVTVANASAEVTRQMMNCLKNNSSGDAVQRCQYPEPLPPLVVMMMEINSNITGIPTNPVPPSNMEDQVMPISRISRSDSLSDQSMELLVTADNQPPSLNFPPFLTAVRHVQKRSVLSIARPEVETAAKIQSSLVENDPLIHFLKYYAKHKVWEGANLNNDRKKFQEFELNNHLHSVHKRAIENNKKMPENPFQDLSEYVKHKPGVNYIKDDTLVEKIKAALEKMDDKTSSRNLLRKLSTITRPKRSITYEKDIDMPLESIDPQKDISFYTKNKEGRRYNNDLRQTLLVRGGLEQAFNTGNIEVVRRFGANYNPAIPNPFVAAVIQTQADF